MQPRLTTTVLAVVGPKAAACVTSLEAARNVTTLLTSSEDDPVQQTMKAWRQAARSRSLYTVHNADPLQPVVDSWSALFDGGPRGDLEVAVAETLARERSGAIGLPDFYLVVDPENFAGRKRDWYLGVLHRAAPHRVVPVAPEGELVRAALASLPHGKWWPEVNDLLEGLDLTLPDQPMVSTSSASDILT